MSVTLTERAAQHVQSFLAKRGKGVGLRVWACAPRAAPAWPTSSSSPTRSTRTITQFDSHGVKVLVDPKSLPYLDGTELDFAREGLNEGFKFNNPNVKDECGCGESFNV